MRKKAVRLEYEGEWAMARVWAAAIGAGRANSSARCGKMLEYRVVGSTEESTADAPCHGRKAGRAEMYCSILYSRRKSPLKQVRHTQPTGAATDRRRGTNVWVTVVSSLRFLRAVSCIDGGLKTIFASVILLWQLACRRAEAGYAAVAVRTVSYQGLPQRIRGCWARPADGSSICPLGRCHGAVSCSVLVVGCHMA